MRESSHCILMVMVVVAIVLVVDGAVHLEPSRVKRGIFGTVTKTVYKTIEEKRYVPASCLHIAPNLPDCRNARFLNYNYPTFDTNTVGEDEPQGTSVPSWGDYLGFYRSTVTVTELKIQPTTVVDSRIVVTYDIRGCKPHDTLLSNLPKCLEENSEEVPQAIVPTSTVPTSVKATRLTEGHKTLSDELMVSGSEALENPDEVHKSTASL